MRNQGVGSWEINLAGFFAALNTNSWPLNSYGFSTNQTINTGSAFDDARDHPPASLRKANQRSLATAQRVLSDSPESEQRLHNQRG